MSLDRSMFQQHASEGFFLIAADESRWGIHQELTWPYVIMWVQALAKPGKPERFYFKFNLSGYPGTAPTACPWDIATNTRLDNSRWPKGNNLVSKTFNYGWRQDALYAPCDREAMKGHEAWQTQLPELWWQSNFKINVYLDFLHRLLNSADYARS